jgi:GxxExxY protein
MYEHDPLTHAIIGRAIEVHRHLGPGLFESSYEEALCIELTDAELSFTRQIRVPALYKGHVHGEHRPDLVVAERVLVEIKSVERLHDVHRAQTTGLHARAAVARWLVDEFQQRRPANEHTEIRHLSLGASVPRCFVITRVMSVMRITEALRAQL